MSSPLEGLAATVNSAMSFLFFPATLSRPHRIGPGYNSVVAAPTLYTCRALVESYDFRFYKENLVPETDRKVMILSASVNPVTDPRLGDTLIVYGPSTETLKLVGEPKTDPAKAVWEVQGRV